MHTLETFRARILVVLAPMLLVGGCHDWLSAPKAVNNPNQPTTASSDALLIGITVDQTTLQTGDIPRALSMWTQQMAGTDRQYVGLGAYVMGEDTFGGDWTAVYTGGGLIDIRQLERQTLATGDSIYAGVAYVWEALTMGTAADLWGDIPYSEADPSHPTPKLDPQQQVYQTVQAKLDTAIRFLACTSATCQGPAGVDLIYRGDPTRWTEAAHTLKARFYLHVAARDPSAYALALAQTASGISDPTHDFTTYQSNNPNERNLWFQFTVLTRNGYISGGQYLVDLLRTTTDPRLSQYFTPNSAGQFVGAPPGVGPGDWATLGGARVTPAFRQPVITYAENALIRAEAALRTGQQAVANAAYNAERASQGVALKSGNVTLTDVLTEKYIALFQQIEAWNDYKRTCLPAITPATAAGVPRRLFYPATVERNSNPNVPAPDRQPARNWNDPTGCPAGG